MKIRNRQKHIICVMGMLTLAIHGTTLSKNTTNTVRIRPERKETSTKAPRPGTTSSAAVCPTCPITEAALVQDCVCQELAVSGNTTIDGNISITETLRAEELIVLDGAQIKKAKLQKAEIGTLEVDNAEIESASIGDLTVTGIFGEETSDVASTTAVVIDKKGNLGTVPSAQRFKENVEPLSDDDDTLSERFAALRPVSFSYKSDATRKKQYGLIAEEVDTIFPELTVRDSEGRIYSISYQLLHAIIIAVLQKLDRKASANDVRLVALETELGTVRSALNDLEDEDGDEVDGASIETLRAQIANLQTQINDIIALLP